MTTLRDHVRRALRSEQLTAREAADDFEQMTARARGRPRPRAPIALALAFAGVAAIGAFVVVTLSRPRSSTPTEIYVHVVGEPAGDALSLTIVESNVTRSALALAPRGE